MLPPQAAPHPAETTVEIPNKPGAMLGLASCGERLPPWSRGRTLPCRAPFLTAWPWEPPFLALLLPGDGITRSWIAVLSPGEILAAPLPPASFWFPLGISGGEGWKELPQLGGC